MDRHKPWGSPPNIVFGLGLLFIFAVAVVWAAQATRTLRTVSPTVLEVQEFTKEFPKFSKSAEMNGAQPFNFRWSTSLRTPKSARWEVTNPQSQLLASGPIAFTAIPKAGGEQTFSIDFRKFAPAKPPTAPNVFVYYVKVVPLDANGGRLAASEPVTIRQRSVNAAQPGIFPDDLGKARDELAHAMLQKVATTFKKKFKIGDPLGPEVSNDKVAAHQRYHSTDGYGYVSIEVHRKPTTRIFICVPNRKWDDISMDFVRPNANPTYSWFEFKLNEKSELVRTGDQYPPPDFTPAVLRRNQDWCQDDTYDREVLAPYDDDPPHWTPIMILDAGYYGRGTILDVHQAMQSGATQPQGVAILDNHRRSVLEMDGNDLSTRAECLWPPAALRGMVLDGDWPGGDLNIHHTVDYLRGDEDEAATGGDPPWDLLGNSIPYSKSPIWPGADWDVLLLPDRAYNYLANAGGTNDDTLHVEIESFSLPHFYRPQTNEWLQVMGRWVIDDGHTDANTDQYYCEIHPPELLITSTADPYYWSARGPGEYVAEARVIVTGAYTGSHLDFVVNPPPRPTATSVLKWAIIKPTGEEGVEWQKFASIKAYPVPKENPNHVYCIVDSMPGHKPPIPHDTGVVSQREQGLRCYVRCWWEDTVSTVRGTVKSANGPALGSYVFYRPAALPNIPWRSSPVDAQGNYIIPGLAAGETYLFRPAGSGWDFAGVPKSQKVTGGNVSLSFNATRRPRITLAPLSREKFVGIARSPSRQPLKPAVSPASAESADPHNADLSTPEGVESTLNSLLTTIKEPAEPLGVQGNQFGYEDEATIGFHLMGLIGWDDKPIKTRAEAYTMGRKGKETTMAVNGTPSLGVPGARVRATLILGNRQGGRFSARSTTATTDRFGLVRFRIGAGTLMEQASLLLEVVENPINPWYRPRIETNLLLFYPAKIGDDVPPPAPVAYSLQALAIQLTARGGEDIKAAVAEKLGAIEAVLKVPGPTRKQGIKRVAKHRALPALPAKLVEDSKQRTDLLSRGGG